MVRGHRVAAKAAVAERSGLVGRLTLVAVFLAAIQSVAIAIAPGVPGLTYLDDGAVLLLLVACLAQLGRAPGLPVYLAFVWLVLMVIAALNATVPADLTFVLFRQVVIPALLIVIGLSLSQSQWGRVKRLAIGVGLANAGYMLLEIVGVRLLDPASLVNYSDNGVWLQGGVPGYYLYYFGPGSFLSQVFGSQFAFRAGGLVLNPPIAGLVTATAFVFLYRHTSARYRKLGLTVLALATAASFSRGGLLVLLVAIVLPYLLRKWGRTGVILTIAPAAWLVGNYFSDHGKSGVHAEGLVDGLRHAAEGVFGVGFGSSGNYLKLEGLTQTSESLLGIAFSGAGLAAVAVAGILMGALFVVAARSPHISEAALGLGVVAAALFSETAGALNGTVPLWLAVGVALAAYHRERTGDALRAGTVGDEPQVRQSREQRREGRIPAA